MSGRELVEQLADVAELHRQGVLDAGAFRRAKDALLGSAEGRPQRGPAPQTPSPRPLPQAPTGLARASAGESSGGRAATPSGSPGREGGSGSGPAVAVEHAATSDPRARRRGAPAAVALVVAAAGVVCAVAAGVVLSLGLVDLGGDAPVVRAVRAVERDGGGAARAAPSPSGSGRPTGSPDSEPAAVASAPAAEGSATPTPSPAATGSWSTTTRSTPQIRPAAAEATAPPDAPASGPADGRPAATGHDADLAGGSTPDGSTADGAAADGRASGGSGTAPTSSGADPDGRLPDGSVRAELQAPACPFTPGGAIIPTWSARSEVEQAALSPAVRFASGLNADAHACAYDALSPAYRSAHAPDRATWEAQQATSDVVAYEVVALRLAGSSASLRARWTSTQAPEHAPAGSGGETCSIWSLEYTLAVDDDGVWRFDAAHGEWAPRRACE